MEKLKTFVQGLSITRAKLEIITVIILVVCGLSVFALHHRTKVVLTYDHGRIKYTGYVLNHRMNGKGKLTYGNGDIYSGEFRDGQFSGLGTYKASSGWSYSGRFKNGQADGKGILKAKNGKVYEGTFKQGIYQK
ncbi:hypothetical protein [Streptococcus porcinus]|uniref:MORN repeat protein n=1 Tax=Streptococcus porcinus TaxID=1340 RepID=A0A7V9WQL2_STRPO|nr:hypothetical protein [Streptococcus porcinus]MBA2795240.1 hypothetical protein [Streptococcus porcinus]